MRLSDASTRERKLIMLSKRLSAIPGATREELLMKYRLVNLEPENYAKILEETDPTILFGHEMRLWTVLAAFKSVGFSIVKTETVYGVRGLRLWV